MGKVSGETALVTGATSGIGRATALALARRGASVCALGRNEAAGAALVAEIEDGGGNAIFSAVDITRSDDVRAAVDLFAEAQGGLDTVVSSAGIAEVGSIVDLDEETWHRVIDTNLNGTFYLARHCLPHLLADGGGSFTAVSSDAGVWGACGYAAYCASKHGLNGLIKCLALDHGPRGVRANAVCPGFVETPMTDALFEDMSDDEIDYFRKSVPLGRFATPEDVANTITFLSSPAGAYTNGIMYMLEGGATAGYFSSEG